MTRQDKMLKAALAYRQHFNFSIIPSNQEKKPLIGWKQYQEQLPTIEEIQQWWGVDYLGANISLVCGEKSNRIVVDIDKYKDPKALDIIEEITPENLFMPIVDTPRGGEHRHFLWDEQVKCSGDNNQSIDVKAEGGLALLPPSIFQGKEYAWRNGFSIRKIATPPIPASYISFFISSLYTNYSEGTNPARAYIKGDDSISTEYPQDIHSLSKGIHTYPQGLIPDGQRDHKLFHLANFLVKGGMPQPEVQQYLLLFARHCCETGFTDQEAIVKVESAMKREYDKTKTLADMVREFIEDAEGTFLSTDIHRYTQVSTYKEKKNISEILRRLVVERLIERHGSKNGCFRKVRNDLGLTSIKDVKHADPLKIRLPLGFQQHVDIFHKDIIAVAGSPNVGKTTMMIECAKLNMHDNNICYWSTETGLTNMRQRLNKSQEIDADRWDFKISDQFDENYEDAIGYDPDAIHIFDYIEATDGEYYKIPSKLSRIHTRLRKGIAFVALQKREGGGTYGGQQTEAKPAIFLTIDRENRSNIMRVKKAKNFSGENPNGFFIRFKIVQGINIIPEGIWKPEM